jgi:phospholipid/cholesterol/gamma-HCH transport system substrate-binding protein
MVTDLNKTATVLAARPGQLRAVVDSLADTARVLGSNADPVDRTIATLPETLRTTRLGADDLAGTLGKLTEVAGDARPTAQRLDPLLRQLDPTLAQLRPMLGDLRPLLEDAKPLVGELVPTVDAGTDVLTNLQGPVLDRVNGPILGAVNDRWHGLAPKYPNGGDGAIFYQELGYAFSHLTNSLRHQDATSHMLGFQPGAGSTSVSGTGVTAQRLQDFLSEMYGPPHRTPPTPLGPRLPKGIPVPDPGIEPPVLDPNKGPTR